MDETKKDIAEKTTPELEYNIDFSSMDAPTTKKLTDELKKIPGVEILEEKNGKITKLSTNDSEDLLALQKVATDLNCL